MRNRQIWLTAVVVPMALLLSVCDHASTASNTDVRTEEQSAKPGTGSPDYWPTWDTRPDKARKEKSVLRPTVAFTVPGFRGSPAPRNDREKDHELKNRKDFAEVFKNERECFGITLAQKNPDGADFGIQLFDATNGRPNQWQWILYRMDTLGEKAHGETTGGGISDVAKEICSSVHGAITSPGGRVED